MTHFTSAGKNSEQICLSCFNHKAAERMGVDDFEHVDFHPMSFRDASGLDRSFYFQFRVIPFGVGLYATEYRPDDEAGHSFGIGGSFGDDPQALFETLVNKIKTNLNRQHIVQDEYGWRIKNQTVRGQISSHLQNGRQEPVLVVDGKKIHWDDFGQMLSSFEGWQFRLEILDTFEEL